MANTFHNLTVSQIDKSTKDCAIISLEVPESLQDTFDYKQGQYLTLKAIIENEEVIRSYSLCSSPIDKQWQIGVKQITDGVFSTWANTTLKPGDQIQAAIPEGRFYVEVESDAEKHYMAIAAGSGITPVFSIIKTHLKAEPKSRFTLLYTSKSVDSIILKEDLLFLKNQFMDRLQILFFLTREQRSTELYNGRLDEEKLDEVFKSIIKLEEVDEFFSCGPEAMTLMVRDYLTQAGVQRKKIHFELFHAEGAAPEIKQDLQLKFEGKHSAITLIEGGKSIQFSIPVASDNILDAALKNNTDLPFACKGGVCCTCRAKIIEGEVKMLVNYALEEEEVAEGYILTCQALPLSEKVIVDFDA
ncbi:MAG: ring-1,2-phenylacetyl-CoA epoxidase subunit PaaE [Limisphaerales bacterium]|jgi:ring-1,2-phenylacetyl-CoA epoxidase subunit PaaE